MKRTVDLTLVISDRARYPYFSVRILGPRTKAQLGELEVPVRIAFDDAWLHQRTARVEFDIPTPATPVIASNEG